MAQDLQLFFELGIQCCLELRAVCGKPFDGGGRSLQPSRTSEKQVRTKAGSVCRRAFWIMVCEILQREVERADEAEPRDAGTHPQC